MKKILSHSELQSQVDKLAGLLLQNHPNITDVVLIGIQQGGVMLADDIVAALKKLQPGLPLHYGQLDITFYRDDIRKEILAPDVMHIPFSIEDKKVILIDDVLFTGRTIKAALDALIDLGRPEKIELCVLVDRKEHRQFPIQADYTGVTIETNRSEKIKLIKDPAGNKHVVLLSE
ncbi:bifunctional pyr operon transcriptional regulator/uracil phosphoribosyltransferase PyrR [Ferruginibacter lapsinanis]|uniref:bifunctional pyr operon transcriptional regulator/uracil phosphoribosyltransferase PyrR n=1 Tax=Ferruginibacter lapsinanis TaxID=563172 RepID=UPI001E44DEA2|nr:bifunctional pyr operon transcriptional regulator/uracil phosphoribosyltransferase PyrR [Ferruginibacter lapsinanis]UEG49597.1 bifunctional pyr operon transcriptional regulator/uracil phosphoribosyltransferase PyrR [Ferruginibacter lapsinanis]